MKSNIKLRLENLSKDCLGHRLLLFLVSVFAVESIHKTQIAKVNWQIFTSTLRTAVMQRNSRQGGYDMLNNKILMKSLTM